MLTFDACILQNLNSSANYRTWVYLVMGVFLLCGTNALYTVGALQ